MQSVSQSLKDARSPFSYLENSLDAFLGLDSGGLVVYANRAALETFPKLAEALHFNIFDLAVDPYSPDMQKVRSVLEGGAPERFEHYSAFLDCYFDVHIFSVPDGAGIFFKDTTQQRQAEEAIRRSSQRYQLLYDAGQSLSSTLDPSTIYERLRMLISKVTPVDGLVVSSYNPAEQLITCTYAWVNGNIVDHTQLPPVPLAPEGGVGMQSQVIREGRPRLFVDVAQQVKHPKGKFYDISPDGKQRELREGSPPVTQAALMVPLKLSGEVRGVVQVMSDSHGVYDEEDLQLFEALVNTFAVAIQNALLYSTAQAEIAERERIENQLRDSEAQFRQLAEVMPQIVWTIDADGGTDYINDQYHRYTGLSKDIPPKAGWDLVVHPEDKAHSLSLYQACYATGKTWEQEIRLRRHDGVYRWHLSRQVPIRDEEGNIIRWFATSTDIHALKEAEATIRDHNQELEKRVAARTSELESTNRDMQHFTYSVSHDLRAPLRSIVSHCRMLQEDYASSLPSAANVHFEKLIRSARDLAQLVDDLLSLTRLGKQEVSRAAVDVTACAHEIATQHIEEGCEATFRIDSHLQLMADPALAKLLLQNLIQNATKFHEEPDKALVEVGRRGEAFFVRDNGIGIPAAYSDKIFLPFERLFGQRFTGTGIGLAIVQRIAERHGGRVWFESEPGKGSTFYFIL